MFWQLVLMAAAVCAVYYRWSRRRLYRLAKQISSPIKSYPIIGHAYMFMGSSEDRMKTLQKFGKITNEQDGLLSAWLGNRLFICMTDPEAIEIVSKACLDKDEFTMKFMRTAIGNGLSSAPVSIWHPRRKLDAPFFSVKNLHRLIPIFNEKSSTMVKLMRTEAGGGDFSMWRYMSTLTFDTVSETAGGVQMNSQENPNNFLLCAINEVAQMISERMLQPWLHPDFIYENLPVYKKFQRHVQRAHHFIDEMINKAQGQSLKTAGIDLRGNCLMSSPSNLVVLAPEGRTWNVVYKENEENYDRYTFLDMLKLPTTGTKRVYSDLELREEVLVMIVAGSDTSATAASFTSVLLSRYPDVQNKVHEELHEVFGGSDRPVTPEDLPRLKYLEAVIKECLRLYPPVPVVAREVRKDVVLPSGATLVDGTSVGINIWGTHRNSSYWGEDVELFRPERFLEGPLRHPAQFIPFSYSLRGCIGSTYAMMFIKTSLADLLRRYRLLPPASARAADLTRPLPVKFDIMMKAVDGFIVRVEDKNNIR